MFMGLTFPKARDIFTPHTSALNGRPAGEPPPWTLFQFSRSSALPDDPLADVNKVHLLFLGPGAQTWNASPRAAGYCSLSRRHPDAGLRQAGYNSW